MYNAKESAAKNWTVAGKLSTLVVSLLPGLVSANDLFDPKFFEYRSNGVINNIFDVSFGWFKKLSDEEKNAYHQSIIHAVSYAENGDAVTWYQGRASGRTVPVMTWPTSSGYCRRVHIAVNSYSITKDMSVTACYNELQDRWTWHDNK
jgi:surface antigen